ncbi:hypothetical protein FTO65_24680 [Bacillus cereus]|nr:hypothetical protein [Bacillus cereus]
MRSSLICELINFIFYFKILLRLYYSNTISKKQPLIYTKKQNGSVNYPPLNVLMDCLKWGLLG